MDTLVRDLSWNFLNSPVSMICCKIVIWTLLFCIVFLPSIASLWVIMKGCWNLSKAFSIFIEIILWFLLVSLVDSFIDLCILNYIFGVKDKLLMMDDFFFLLNRQIGLPAFVGDLCVYKDISLFISFYVYLYMCFCVRLLLALLKEFWSIPFYFVE